MTTWPSTSYAHYGPQCCRRWRRTAAHSTRARYGSVRGDLWARSPCTPAAARASLSLLSQWPRWSIPLELVSGEAEARRGCTASSLQTCGTRTSDQSDTVTWSTTHTSGHAAFMRAHAIPRVQATLSSPRPSTHSRRPRNARHSKTHRRAARRRGRRHSIRERLPCDSRATWPPIRWGRWALRVWGSATAHACCALAETDRASPIEVTLSQGCGLTTAPAAASLRLACAYGKWWCARAGDVAVLCARWHGCAHLKVTRPAVWFSQ